MISSRRMTDRGVTSVLGVILMIAVAVILGATVGVVVLGIGEASGEPAPTTALEPQTAADTDNVTVQHLAGERLDRGDLEIQGAKEIEAPAEIAAGDEITVEPKDGVDSVVVSWHGDGNTAVLATVPVFERDLAGATIELSLDTERQFEQEELRGVELSDPMTVEVELTENGDPVSGEERLDVTVTDYLGEFGPPSNALSGSETIEFDDGVGTFTIAESETEFDGPGFELPPFFLSNLNDIDTLEVTAGNGEIQALRVQHTN